MEKGRSPAETALKPLRNPGAEQRQHEAGIEDSISEWMDTNFPQENYVPPVLSEDEFRKLEPAPRNSICPASSEKACHPEDFN
jgi:hypothetical protein